MILRLFGHNSLDKKMGDPKCLILDIEPVICGPLFWKSVVPIYCHRLISDLHVDLLQRLRFVY